MQSIAITSHFEIVRYQVFLIKFPYLYKQFIVSTKVCSFGHQDVEKIEVNLLVFLYLVTSIEIYSPTTEDKQVNGLIFYNYQLEKFANTILQY